MSIADQLRLNLGARKSKHANAAEFCVDTERAIHDWQETGEDLTGKVENAFPTGSDQRRANAFKALEMLLRSVENMTPQESLSLAVAVGLTDALEIPGDAGIAEANQKLAHFFGALTVPQALVDDREKERAWVVRLIADKWQRHFEEMPGTSKNSPFVACVRAVCKSLDYSEPKAETVSELL